MRVRTVWWTRVSFIRFRIFLQTVKSVKSVKNLCEIGIHGWNDDSGVVFHSILGIVHLHERER